MASVKATVEVPVEVSTVFQYLRDSYEGQAYRSACMQVKGYILPIARLETVDNKMLRFSVPGRDAIFGSQTGGWTWTFELEDLGNSTTRITIDYSWNWFLSMLGLGTMRLQAANALTQDVLAIEALAFRRS